MKKLAMLLALLLGVAAMVYAKAPQNAQDQNKTQAVRITKGPVVEYVDDKSAVVAWSTNVSGGTSVLYGTNQGQLNQSAKAPWGGLTHRVNINNLQPNTTYYFVVDTGQAAGTGSEARTGVQSFTTTSPGKRQNYPQGQPR